MRFVVYKFVSNENQKLYNLKKVTNRIEKNLKNLLARGKVKWLLTSIIMPTIIATLIIKSLNNIAIMTLTIILLHLNNKIKGNVEECLNKIELLPCFEILNVERLDSNFN